MSAPSINNSIMTITTNQDISNRPLTLILRNRPEIPPPRLQWAEGTVDNEYMDKKKSKCCCIYEKPKKFDESSSSNSESEKDEDCCNSNNKQKKLKKKRNIAKVSTDHCRGHTNNCYVKKKDKKQEVEYPVVIEYDFSKLDNDGSSHETEPKNFEI